MAVPSSAEQVAPTKAPRRITAGKVVAWVLITMLLWLGAAGLLAWDAQGHARAAETSLRTIADLADGDLSEVDFEQVEVQLTAGRSELIEARTSISSPIVGGLGWVPVLGRQLQSAEALIVVSDDLAAALQPLVASAKAAQAGPNSIDRVAFLEDTTAQLAELRAVAESADLGPAENLVQPLFDGRLELEEQLADLAADAAEYEAITRGLASFFGESTYLVLGANNAEMQLGGGMHLSVGRVVVANGDFELPGLEASADLFPVPDNDVVDADVEDRWGALFLSNDYRKLHYSARFDEFTAPQALSMWQAQTGEELDGVISLDPFVLDAILGVVGEVEVEGETFGGGSALTYLLRGQYELFDDGDDDAGDLVDERRDRLSLIANAAVDQLTSSSWDPIELIDALRPLAQGRHLMVYSTRPAEQAAWSQLGVDGAVPVNATNVALINDGGAKLDPFVSLRVAGAAVDEGDVRTVTYDITIENRAPAEGLPRYTVGPWRTVGLDAPGTYFGRLAVYVPGYAANARFVGPVLLGASGPDGALLLNATQPVSVAPGASETFTFRFEVPVSAGPLRLMPSARFPAVPWEWRGEAITDRVFVDLE